MIRGRSLLHTKYLDESARLLNPYAREVEPSDGDRAFITGLITPRGVDKKSRRVSGMVSTANIDRYEEIIEPEAFAKWLPEFAKNPQFLAGHQMAAPSSGEPTNIGKWIDLQIVKGEGLHGTAQFMEPGDPLADAYWRRYEQGVLRAFSVGVITHAWEMREYEIEPRVKKRLRVFTEVELVEISAVSVPANRQALVRAAVLGPPGSGGSSLLDDTFDDDASGGTSGGGTSGGGMSNRQLRSMVFNCIRPAVKDAIREELREVIEDECAQDHGIFHTIARDVLDELGDEVLEQLAREANYFETTIDGQTFGLDISPDSGPPRPTKKGGKNTSADPGGDDGEAMMTEFLAGLLGKDGQ